MSKLNVMRGRRSQYVKLDFREYEMNLGGKLDFENFDSLKKGCGSWFDV
jgi:hypothetical protein